MLYFFECMWLLIFGRLGDYFTATGEPYSTADRFVGLSGWFLAGCIVFIAWFFIVRKIKKFLVNNLHTNAKIKRKRLVRISLPSIAIVAILALVLGLILALVAPNDTVYFIGIISFIIGVIVVLSISPDIIHILLG